MKRTLAALLVGLTVLTGCGGATPSQQAPAAAAKSAEVGKITAAELLKKVQAGEKLLIVDVRTEEEFQAGHIEGAKLVTLQSLPDGAKGLGKADQIILICRSGNRSTQAAQLLVAAGFTNLVNVTDGMTAWEKAGGPVVK
ncbi:MAG: sulfurtransferase [Symbiobacteriaceae bacterium]|jgi:rhodanese-related sulfurtransferase|nr:sulfurtransferase [Symbiobacteriaceae bacterium]